MKDIVGLTLLHGVAGPSVSLRNTTVFGLEDYKLNQLSGHSLDALTRTFSFTQSEVCASSVRFLFAWVTPNTRP